MKTIIGKREISTSDVLKELRNINSNHKKHGRPQPTIGIDTLCLLLDLVTPEIMLHLEKLEQEGMVRINSDPDGSTRTVTILSNV